MSNPELRQHRDLDPSWVEYAQGLLILHLDEHRDAGEIELSAVDGIFGDLTDGSVRFFQRLRGLDVDGIIGPDTWAALEADPPGTPPAADSDEDARQDAASGPIDLRVPFELHLRWDELRLGDLTNELQSLRLSEHSGARLTFFERVGPIFANGGKTWLELELNNNPHIYFEAATRAIVSWSDDKGLELGADNDLELGLRLRGVDLFLSGDIDARLHPMVPSGSLSGGGMLNLRLKFDELVR